MKSISEVLTHSCNIIYTLAHYKARVIRDKYALAMQKYNMQLDTLDHRSSQTNNSVKCGRLTIKLATGQANLGRKPPTDSN